MNLVYKFFFSKSKMEECLNRLFNHFYHVGAVKFVLKKTFIIYVKKTLNIIYDDE